MAAYARVEGEEIEFACEILSEEGSERIAERAKFAVGDLEKPATLARRMLRSAPPSIRRLFG